MSKLPTSPVRIDHRSIRFVAKKEVCELGVRGPIEPYCGRSKQHSPYRINDVRVRNFVGHKSFLLKRLPPPDGAESLAGLTLATPSSQP